MKKEPWRGFWGRINTEKFNEESMITSFYCDYCNETKNIRISKQFFDLAMIYEEQYPSLFFDNDPHNHLKMAVGQLQQDFLKNEEHKTKKFGYGSLGEHEKILIDILREKKEMGTGELYDAYLQEAKKRRLYNISDRQLRYYLVSFESLKMVSLEQIEFGKGRTTNIKYLNDLKG